VKFCMEIDHNHTHKLCMKHLFICFQLQKWQQYETFMIYQASQKYVLVRIMHVNGLLSYININL